MYRALTSSNRAVAQGVIRSTLTFTRNAAGSDPEAGSVGGGQDAFGKKEKAEETRWARRFEAEQAEKYRNRSGQDGGQQQQQQSGTQQRSGDSRGYGQQQSGTQQRSGDSRGYGQQQSGTQQRAGDSRAYSQQQSGSQQRSGGSSQQRLDELEAEKRRIDQEIAQLKRQQH